MKKYGEKFDAYIGVSEFTTDSFKKCYPNLSKKAYTIYNILPEIDPYEKRICPPELVTSKKNCIKILTICRMADQAKGLFRMEKYVNDYMNCIRDNLSGLLLEMDLIKPN